MFSSLLWTYFSLIFGIVGNAYVIWATVQYRAIKLDKLSVWLVFPNFYQKFDLLWSSNCNYYAISYTRIIVSRNYEAQAWNLLCRIVQNLAVTDIVNSVLIMVPVLVSLHAGEKWVLGDTMCQVRPHAFYLTSHAAGKQLNQSRF